MRTRSFIFAALTVGLFLMTGAVQALTIKPFSSAELAAAQNAGAAVAVHFRADWCPTCKAQDQAFNTLKVDPTLEHVTLLLADYDQERALKKQMKVRMQSTVVVFKGWTEVARDSGSTDPAKIKAFLGSDL